MNRRTRSAIVAFGATIVVCISAAATTVMPERAADATDLGIVDVAALIACAQPTVVGTTR